MSDDYPKYFYKYRSIGRTDDLQKDYAVDALLKNEAVFSSRTNFNDLFDSKIELIKPTPLQFKEAMKLAGKSDKLQIKKFLNKGKLSSEGVEFGSFVRSCWEAANQARHTDAFVSVSLRQSHRRVLREDAIQLPPRKYLP